MPLLFFTSVWNPAEVLSLRAAQAFRVIAHISDLREVDVTVLSRFFSNWARPVRYHRMCPCPRWIAAVDRPISVRWLLPFGINSDPNAPNLRIPDVVPPLHLSPERLANPHKLLQVVDRLQASGEEEANSSANDVRVFQRKAFELITSPATKKAFDIDSESAKLRDAFGRQSLGQSCLVACRLVEAGVLCVTIDHSNLDTHDNNFTVLKNSLLPAFDSAVSPLFRDLCERGLLESTLDVVTGEFGRTPRINKNAGRDHWCPALYDTSLRGRYAKRASAWENRC